MYFGLDFRGSKTVKNSCKTCNLEKRPNSEIQPNFCEKLDAQSNQINQLETELKELNCIATAESAAAESCKNDVRDAIEDDFTEGKNEDLANEEDKIGDFVKTEEKSDQQSQDPVSPKTSVSEIDESSGTSCKTTKSYGIDEISKIQILEKEMSELKGSLEDSQSQDRIYPNFTFSKERDDRINNGDAC